MSQTLSQFLVGAAGVLVTLVGVFLSRVAKKGEQTAAAITDQFTRQQAEIAYLSGELKAERDDKRTILTRCRETTNQAAQTILALLGAVKNPDVLEQGQQTLRAIQDHNAEDH